MNRMMHSHFGIDHAEQNKLVGNIIINTMSVPSNVTFPLPMSSHCQTSAIEKHNRETQ